ncbi:unnamed protein product [Diabrotica balteata]|uniref:Lipase domain-containing protein n=1 Tax=Diabrotica balteata TaxID=107213 RepID=A0A9N9SX11_DIABA|nr:unnamed protein product [Diabrotica balteata]
MRKLSVAAQTSCNFLRRKNKKGRNRIGNERGLVQTKKYDYLITDKKQIIQDVTVLNKLSVGSDGRRLRGLDPAFPMFTIFLRNVRLRSTDARFVQVIHTSILGGYENMGHADYYANRLIRQPGCPIAIIEGFSDHLKTLSIKTSYRKHNQFVDFVLGSDGRYNCSTPLATLNTPIFQR